MPDLDRNKQNLMAFYDLMFNQCRPRDAIERYAGVQYVQHNPGVAAGLFPEVDNRCTTEYQYSSDQDDWPRHTSKEDIVDDLKCDEQ